MPAGTVSSLLDISRRSLIASQQAIHVIGNNIANSTNEAYSKRQAVLTTTESIGLAGANFGTGVQVERVIRIIDEFLNAEVRERSSQTQASTISTEFLQRAETFFSLNNTAGSIGASLGEFFSALEDVSANPADSGLRSNIIAKGRILVQNIKSTYNELATLQREADNRLQFVVTQVNSLSLQLADLNGRIANSGGTQETNLDLLDQRDDLLSKLSELVGVSVIENENGTVLASLENGFALVTLTTSNQLEYTVNPDFAPPGGYPPGLDGTPLGWIVYDYDPSLAGTAHVNLMPTLLNSAGELGGLLLTRGIQADTHTNSFQTTGDIVAVARRVEGLARDLLLRFNTEYLGPDEDTVTAGFQPSAHDLDGNPPPVFGLFKVSGLTDNNGDGLPDGADLTASGFNQFAGRLKFGFNDPRAFAAGRDQDPADGVTAFTSGDDSNAAAVATLRTTANDYSTLGIGLNLTTSIESLYENTVTSIGAFTEDAQNRLEFNEARSTLVEEFQASVSGVSLDEEFTTLITFQKQFQASARTISMSDELLGELINIL